jgi:beta-fructofuranosidase
VLYRQRQVCDGSRTAWQCLATENADGTFSKTGPVLPLPEGYTGHVRDPKVWRHEDRWYMVLGAQDRQKRGKVLLFSSRTFISGRSEGEIAGAGINGLHDAGYMWECPDLFPLGDQHILICCPQGIAREKERYLNTYPAVWMAGGFDYASAAFTHGELHELDAGFEFYAPQTMQTSDGRRLLVGWMGVPDGEEMRQPTRQRLDPPDDLPARTGVYRRQTLSAPLRELSALRGEARLAGQRPAAGADGNRPRNRR